MKQFEKVTKTYETEDISKVNCDRCGREIDLNIKKEKYVGLSFSLRNTFDRENSFPYYDLCNNCARMLYMWFKYKLDNEKYYKEDFDYFLDPDDDYDED